MEHKIYGRYIKAVFDLYRFDLANELNIVVSKNPIEEKKTWTKLQHFLLDYQPIDQVNIGENIVQTQSIGQADLEELRKSLLNFQKGVAKLNLSPEYQSVVNGDINAAIIEAKEDKPALSGIKDRFESAINIIKKAGKTIKDISELYEPATKIAKLVGIGLSFLL